MTEEEWARRENPKQMLQLLADLGVGGRPFLLFAAACCRRIWAELDDERSRRAVEMLEAFADGEEVDLADALRLAEGPFRPQKAGYGAWAPREAVRPGKPHVRAREASVWAARVPAIRVSRDGVNGDQRTFDAERRAQSDLLRDIAGIPHRPATLDQSALIPSVVSLAESAYEHRELPSGHLEPARLAVLSDALEEAGCADVAVLSHLRSPGPHVRGCWTLDVILDKA